MGKNKKRAPNKGQPLTGAFAFQPISQPDCRDKKTGMAVPDAENVSANREFVQENKK